MTLPRLRQIILLTGDLDAALARAKDVFGFESGVRDEKSMSELGFEHEVFTFGDTFLEIVAPLSPDSSHGRLIAEHGDSGYMVDVQVGDLDDLVERAAALGFAPVLKQVFEGQRITQWHPRSLGTLAEFDQMEPADTWHFAPRIFDARTTHVARDICAATLAAADPESMARTWATLLQRPLEGTTVRLPDEMLRFVPVGDGRPGLREVDVVASSAERVGDTVELCGVAFRFVAGTDSEARTK
jgi:catechol 2,3-dioxygenase-like lactoylglutathione lyase family enzyme